MSRFYELLKEREDPGSALRSAQLWLRSLSPAEEDRYLAARPALRAQRAEYRRIERSREAPVDEAPYADIGIWGAFVFSGA